MQKEKRFELPLSCNAWHWELADKGVPFDNCIKTFTKERCYQDRITKHVGVKAHVYKSCLKSFYSSSYSAEHTKSCSKEVSFICPTCNKIFSYRAVLKAHKRAEHDSIKHSCQCGRQKLQTRHIIVTASL